MKSIIAATALAFASAASFAAPAFVLQGDGLVPNLQAFTSTKTRAEVRAELFASRARMDYVHMGDELVMRDLFMSVRNLDDVHMEAVRATADKLAARSQYGAQ
ncbi:MAG: DUF4148 domain-containing protein [Aquincola sp.]|nr:DUF4148 domain-containing protein [Aquincola sp.]MDH4288909.1 DUF4148 domain-containing protein [Aquincola sp.]MDH5330514.1 DUF4148 domain-containing protein [Aquincola sp.]